MARGRIVDFLRYVLRLDTKDFERDSRKAEGQVSRLGSSFGKLGGLVKAAAGAFAGFKIGQLTLDMAKTAARTEVLGTVIEQMARVSGISESRLFTLREEVKALGITTQEASGAIIKFVANDLPLDRVTKLADAARNLAVVMGLNTSQAFGRLTNAVIKQETELLRSIGLSTTLEQVQRNLAKETGRTAASFSRAETRTRFLDSVLKEAETRAGSYEASMTKIGKRLTSLPRFFEEAANAVGRFFVPALGLGVDSLTAFLKVITREFSPALSRLRGDIAKFGRSLKSSAGDVSNLKRLRDEFVSLARIQNRSTKEQNALNDVIAELENIMPGLSLVIGNYETNLKGAIGGLDALIDRTETLLELNAVNLFTESAAQFKKAEDQISRLSKGGTGAFGLVNLNLEAANDRIAKLTNSLVKLRSRFDLLRKQAGLTNEDVKVLFDNLESDASLSIQAILTPVQLSNLEGANNAIRITETALKNASLEAKGYADEIAELSKTVESSINSWARFLPALEKGSVLYSQLKRAAEAAGLGVDFIDKIIARQRLNTQEDLALAEKKRLERESEERERSEEKAARELANLRKKSEEQLADITQKARDGSRRAEFEADIAAFRQSEQERLAAAEGFTTERERRIEALVSEFRIKQLKAQFDFNEKIREAEEAGALAGAEKTEKAKAALREQFAKENEARASEFAQRIAEIDLKATELQSAGLQEKIAANDALLASGQVSIDEYIEKLREILIAERDILLSRAGLTGQSFTFEDLVGKLSPEDLNLLRDIAKKLKALDDTRRQLARGKVELLKLQFEAGIISAGKYRKELKRVLEAERDLIKMRAANRGGEFTAEELQNLADINDILDEINNKWKSIADTLGGVASLLDSIGAKEANIARKGADFASSISGAIENASVGNIIGAVASGINFVGSLFGGGPSADEKIAEEMLRRQTQAIESQERLKESLDRLRETIDNDTIATSKAEVDRLRRIDFLFDELKQGSRKLGKETFNELFNELQNLLRSFDLPLAQQTIDSAGNLNIAFGSEAEAQFQEFFNEISQALAAQTFALEPFNNANPLETMKILLRQIAESGGEQGDIGLELIRFWKQFGDLSLEQERDLIKELLDAVEASGDITFGGLVDLKAALESIDDELAQQAEQDSELSQVRRSVTTITEGQANIISATLNSILLVLHDINHGLRGFLDRAANTLAPSVEVIFQSGAIQVQNFNSFAAPTNINEVTATSIEEQLKLNARKMGIKG